MAEPRIIKRYRNRLLYDMHSKEQINLDQVRDLVKAGVDFRVKENHTGRDLTLLVLSQVLGDEIRQWQDRDDANEVLRALIKRGGDASMTILSKTVMAAIGAVAITRENAEKLIDELIKRGELDKGERAEAIKEAVERAEARAKEAVGRVRESVKSSGAREKLDKVVESVTTKVKEIREQANRMRPASNEELDSLKKTIADLEARVAELQEHSKAS
jgi:poly(hydroxyalkanoate) granule-associated protein